MAKAYVVIEKGLKARHALMIMCIEGPAEFIEFATSRLSKRYASMGITEAGAAAGTTRHFFKINFTLRSDFMADWKEAKLAAPDLKKRITKDNVVPDASAVMKAQIELNKAEEALARAIERSPAPVKNTYPAKALSAKRGGVRRAHRQLVINKMEAEVLDALFVDKDRTKPQRISIARVPYKDPYGHPVKGRALCHQAAEEHWAKCVKSHRLAIPIGQITPDYAKRVLETFGSLEAYLGFMLVGNTTALRLPVIERALEQLKEIPAEISREEVLSAYQVATRSVNEFAAWLEMVNAMYHYDVLDIVRGITHMQAFDPKRYQLALTVLKAMRKRLVKVDERQVKDIENPFTISICAPEDEICEPEEAA
jgi:hypothetical protein